MEGEDLAKTLLRSTLRAFYDTRHVLVIDALCHHKALRDDDMAYLMSMPTKELHKLAGKLREDRCLHSVDDDDENDVADDDTIVIASHVRMEAKAGQTRGNAKTYYYIDYRQAIDAIKWRVYKIDKDMQGKTVPASERKEYFCERCKAEWTQMEVLDNVSERGFLCHTCNYPLTHDVERQSGGHKQSTRMNLQFKFITDLLPQLDAVVVPDNTFDRAFDSRVPVIRDTANQVEETVGVDAINRPSAVKGMVDTGPSFIDVKVSASSGPTEEEIAAERERKAKVAAQNVMPSWITKSTVSGDSFRAETTSAIKQENGITQNAKPKESDAKEDAAVDDYFAKLKKQAEEEEKRRAAAAAEEESSEDEDEEFEDVVSTSGAGTSARGTPALGVATSAPVVPSPLRQSSLKREVPSSGNSPGGTPGSDGRPAKKVKVEEPAPPAPANDDDDESEDDLEFEDV